MTTLADLGATFSGLSGKTGHDFGTGSARYITFLTVLNNVVVDVSKFESVRVGPSENQTCVLAGDLLLNGSSETPNEVALCAVMVAEVADLYLNSFCFGFRLRNRSAVDSIFLAYYLRGPVGRGLVRELAQGSTRYNISKSALLKAQLPMPPIKEQRAIATALSDVDALLDALERLIAKKRDIKQAAMQQLLTGQTRLPGFEGEWTHSSLREVAEIVPGINKPLSEMGHGTLYVTVQDVYEGTSIRTAGLGRIQVSPAEIEAKSLKRGDIVFGKSSVKREGIGYPSQFLVCAEPVVFSGFTYRARPRGGVADANFLLYSLRSYETRRWLIDNSQASALTNINQRIADRIPVLLPPTFREQTAIAEVLSEMDAELARLEQRRAKTRALKQGMMQELLTGRTRLVASAEVPA